jgi:phosphoserine aminotransferase
MVLRDYTVRARAVTGIDLTGGQSVFHPACVLACVSHLPKAFFAQAGGLAAVAAANEAKAKVLYDAIETSGGFYNNPVDPAARSLMNVPFTIPSSPDLEKVRNRCCHDDARLASSEHSTVVGLCQPYSCLLNRLMTSTMACMS